MARLQSSIEFQDVGFIYEGNRGGESPPALHNANLTITRGRTTAIIGTSGAGKSTLVDLIVRFFDPTEGRIAVDGVDLREIDLASWRRMIGFVSQDTFLFHDTVLQNIAYGKLGASEEEIVAAAKLAQAHEFILELGQGYQTVIGDRGIKLSGGQRQRLALARAALRDPQILILDEATSGLDSKTERAIQESLDRLSRDRTVIIIAHRLSTIQHVDTIAVLEGGRVVEVGNHETLLNVGNHYAEYHKVQFG